MKNVPQIIKGVNGLDLGFFRSGVRLFPTGPGKRYSFLQPDPDWILRLLKNVTGGLLDLY